jgi:hypothetical protein
MQAPCLLAELISSTLKMEAIFSSEMSVETQRTTRRHIPEEILFITTAVKTSNPTKRNLYILASYLKLQSTFCDLATSSQPAKQTIIIVIISKTVRKDPTI